MTPGPDAATPAAAAAAPPPPSMLMLRQCEAGELAAVLRLHAASSGDYEGGKQADGGADFHVGLIGGVCSAAGVVKCATGRHASRREPLLSDEPSALPKGCVSAIASVVGQWC
jgi:hypothetical protein